MNKIALILEGGGFRGLYTSGVLDKMMEERIDIPYVVGVSMGACNGSAYISEQIGRNKKVNIEYIHDPKYMSFKRLLFKKELFGMDYIFDYIPNNLDVFNFEAYDRSHKNFKMVVTNMLTGKAEYLTAKNDNKKLMAILQASASLPLISREVMIEGTPYLDGGITDPIPFEHALMEGCEKVIVVLTRPRDYIKTPERALPLIQKRYKNFPLFCEAFALRHEKYNAAREKLFLLEREGKALILAPELPLEAKRIEREKEKLYADYDTGYQDCANKLEEIRAFLFSGKVSL